MTLARVHLDPQSSAVVAHDDSCPAVQSLTGPHTGALLQFNAHDESCRPAAPRDSGCRRPVRLNLLSGGWVLVLHSLTDHTHQHGESPGAAGCRLEAVTREPPVWACGCLARAGFLIYRDARPRVARAMHTLHSRTRAGGGGAVATVCEMRAQCSCNALHMQGVGGGGGMGRGWRVEGHSKDLAVTEPGHRHHTYTQLVRLGDSVIVVTR